MAQMDNMDLQNSYICLLRNMEEVLKCRVCEKRIEPPVVVCQKGHSTCGKCKTNTPVCPICNTYLISEKFVILENLLDILPRRCKHFEVGCHEIITGGSCHEKFCQYRPTQCVIGKDMLCDWTGPFAYWFKHTRDISHLDASFWNSSKNLMFVQYYQFHSAWQSYSMILKFKKHYFLLHSIKCESYLTLSAQYICPKPRDATAGKNYILKIMFLKETVVFYTTEVYTRNYNILISKIPIEKLIPLVNSYGELDMHIQLET